MKKILPIISLLGVSTLIVGCSNNMNTKKESFINNINSFKQNVAEYASLNEGKITTTALNKYKLSLESDFDNISALNNDVSHEIINQTEETPSNNVQALPENSTLELDNKEEEIDEPYFDENNETSLENDENSNISTLYSLSNDIEDSCDEFCELKTKITNAILETQNLIEKVQKNEIELSREQRMFITEQSHQLKSLGKQLSNITTELSINLSDLNQIMALNGHDIDNLSLKYLVVLDNLVNGNEMLQNGLSSLNLINQMFNMQQGNTSNNTGRILYGFKQNNEPPVIKEYNLNENGEIVENTEQSPSETEETITESKTNIDTYNNTALESNIDTYISNTPKNIDSFFNTALLDNQFMYGNGYNGYNMYNNPYMNNYPNHMQNLPNNYNAQENQPIKQENKKGKKFKIKKNVDTYMDENELDIKTKLGNIKNSITGFFSKFKKTDLDDKLEKPIYRYNSNDNNE